MRMATSCLFRRGASLFLSVHAQVRLLNNFRMNQLNFLLIAGIVGTPYCPIGLITDLTLHDAYRRLVLCSIDSNFIHSNSCIHQLPRGVVTDLELTSSDCKTCIYRFIASVAENGRSLKDYCTIDPLSSMCLGRVEMTQALVGFQSCNSVSLIYPSCGSQDVRLLLESNIPDQIFDVILRNSSDFSGLDIPNTACGSCYHRFASSLGSAATRNASIHNAVSVCSRVSLYSQECRAGIREFLLIFENCSGFDIGRYGPECSATQRARLESLEPYTVLTNCAFRPQTCPHPERYLVQLQKLSDPTCSNCFSEYLRRLTNTRAICSAGSACDNPNSGSCLSWNSAEIENMVNCTTGSQLSSTNFN
jgi:hypothetical protein